jgi:HK97 family phage prohead protease
MEETKYIEAEITKASDGSFVAVASTNAVDRHGEIVDNNGWELKAFKKNPVILWAHDHDEPAIGVSKKTWVEGSGKSAKLMIQPLIHDVTEKARAVKALIDMGVIKTLSVGFKPLESPDGVTFTKNELLEVSMVNVPANGEAMVMAYKGLKDKGFEDEVLEDIGVPVGVTEQLVTQEKLLIRLNKILKN